MARLFIPNIVDPDLPVFYNVDAVVGAAPAANQNEDVLLVQFLMRLLQKPAAGQAKTLFATMPLTGIADKQTIAGIVKVQEQVKKSNPATIIDGRASPARGYMYGPSFYTIVIMNEFVQRNYYDLWPRLDKMPEAPVNIKNLVFRTLVGGLLGPPNPFPERRKRLRLTGAPTNSLSILGFNSGVAAWLRSGSRRATGSSSLSRVWPRRRTASAR